MQCIKFYQFFFRRVFFNRSRPTNSYIIYLRKRIIDIYIFYHFIYHNTKMVQAVKVCCEYVVRTDAFICPNCWNIRLRKPGMNRLHLSQIIRKNPFAWAGFQLNWEGKEATDPNRVRGTGMNMSNEISDYFFGSWTLLLVYFLSILNAKYLAYIRPIKLFVTYYLILSSIVISENNFDMTYSSQNPILMITIFILQERLNSFLCVRITGFCEGNKQRSPVDFL